MDRAPSLLPDIPWEWGGWNCRIPKAVMMNDRRSKTKWIFTFFLHPTSIPIANLRFSASFLPMLLGLCSEWLSNFRWKGIVSSPLGNWETCPQGIPWFWFQDTVMFNCFLINLIQGDSVWLFSVHIVPKFVSSSETTSCSLICCFLREREGGAGKSALNSELTHGHPLHGFHCR